eukprot:NODE_31500_length_395_cov_1.626866.p4 GENE.NODE_31500_length_395_cov_1.626866~~NODE_31500_length_395_cov_1.626866.p4  ORF type:complete len:55 (-),score=5.22 NODE_31500_length_395_cov_1.626866:229-393(-)
MGMHLSKGWHPSGDSVRILACWTADEAPFAPKPHDAFPGGSRGSTGVGGAAPTE